MVLHARFKDVHAALIHSPCLTKSFMLNGRLARSFPCIITTLFSVALHRCLFFHEFSSLSRPDPVANNFFDAWCMKLSFHQVFIHSNGLRSSELCPFYSNATICLKKFQTAQHSMFLTYLFVQVIKFVDLGCVGIKTWWSLWFLTFASLYMSYQVLKIDENSNVGSQDLGEAMLGFATP
jgi:hypothetical protein